jgi:hypothetical protein
MEVMRTVHLRPYLKGLGPTFTLRLYDTGETDWRGVPNLAYTLSMRTPPPHGNGSKVVLFEGEDYCPSPSTAIDSDASIAGLLGFLTLHPGDTDREYFAEYTKAQLEFCEHHAEILSCYCHDRFGEE